MAFWSPVESVPALREHDGYPAQVTEEEAAAGFAKVAFTPASERGYGLSPVRCALLDMGAGAVALKYVLRGEVRYAFLHSETQAAVDLVAAEPPHNEIGPVSSPALARRALEQLRDGKKHIKP